MTDLPPDHDPLHPDHGLVEAASALVDGAPIPDELAGAAADPRLSALTSHLGAVRQHLAQFPAVEPGMREQHLSAALRAFEASLSVETPIAADQRTVFSLDSARRRRARRLTPVVAAAAAVAVLGVVVGSLANRHSARDSVAGKQAAVTDVAAGSAPKAADAASGSQATPSDTASSVESVRTMSPTAAPNADTATTDGQNAVAPGSVDTVYEASTTAQLPDIAAAVAEAHSSYATPLPANPCTSVTGVAAANIVWIQRPALLFLVPSIEQAAEALVVDPVACTVEASVSLGG